MQYNIHGHVESRTRNEETREAAAIMPFVRPISVIYTRVTRI